MEETIPTDLPLDNMTSGYSDYEGKTDYDCSGEPYGLVVFAGVSLGIALCGLVGNGRVMWFLIFNVKRNPFTVYILNLAVADFSLLLLFSLILLAVLSLVAFCSPGFLSFSRTFAFVVVFLCHFFDLSSLALLTAISVERCISVLFPLWYRCRRPRHLSAIVCGVLWAFAGVFVSSMYFSMNIAEGYGTAFAGGALAISMALSSMMLISNLTLCIKLRRCSHRRHPGRLYVAVLLNVIFFFALGVPFGVEVFLNYPQSGTLFPEYSSFLLALLNSSINPVIYFLVGSCRQRRFQRSVKVAFRRVFEEKPVSEEENHKRGDTVVETTA